MLSTTILLTLVTITPPAVPQGETYHCRGKAPRMSGWSTQSFSARSESEAVAKYRKLRPSHSEVSCVPAN